MNKTEFLNIFDNLIFNRSTREYYGEQEFFNVGYWYSDTQNQQEACFNLMEKLLKFIPDKHGTILDVGSGLGATTNHLLKYYSPADVVGINISANQIARSIINAPGCKFICMDAVQMEFEDNLFDHIICVEAAFYFDTREQFLQEAWRVLKPGGKLILADLIFDTTKYFGDLIVPENIVKDKDIQAYQHLYQQAGFQQLELVDATDACWKTHYRDLKSWIEMELQTGKIDAAAYQMNMVAIDALLDSSSLDYLLVSAQKN
jgi:MPBQ/MSBQ methyltransferase